MKEYKLGDVVFFVATGFDRESGEMIARVGKDTITAILDYKSKTLVKDEQQIFQTIYRTSSDHCLWAIHAADTIEDAFLKFHNALVLEAKAIEALGGDNPGTLVKIEVRNFTSP